MKVLITGIHGFLGTEIANHLKKVGMDVYGTSIQPEDDPQIFKVDITKVKDFNKICIKPDVVLHLAAVREEFGSDEENKKKCTEINTEGALNVANFAVKSRAKHLVYVSSNTVYGKSDKVFKETNKPRPNSYYGTSKYQGEILCYKACSKGNVRLTILRLASIFGKTQKKFLVYSIRSCINSNKDILLYGKGEGKWDLLYVKDLVGVILKVIKDKIYGTYNIGSGKLISVRKIAEIALDVHKESNSKIVFDQNKEENKENILMDISKTKKDMGFKVRYDIKKAFEDMN